MDEMRAVACNYRIPTKICKRGAKAIVISGDYTGNGNARIRVMARSRGGRWVEKWEDSRYLVNFRVVTLMQCHPAFETVGHWSFVAGEPRIEEWLAMMNNEEYYGGAHSPHRVERSVWIERDRERVLASACDKGTCGK